VTTADELLGEVAIRWVEPPERLEYVREALVLAVHRRGPPPAPGRLIGYAETARGSDRLGAERRVFWLAAHDRDSAPGGCYAVGAPVEAVDPLTVAVGVPGRRTGRVDRPAQVIDDPHGDGAHR
jgi:hypothetical protein